MAYIPQPVRRKYIPKPGSAKQRPLGIPCFEDKLVQAELVRILEQVYEQDFMNASYGFRPQRSCYDYNYYGVTDNLPGIKRFGMEVEKLLFKWLNRRGKRGCINWQKFCEMLKRFPLPKPRIRVSMFGFSVN